MTVPFPADPAIAAALTAATGHSPPWSPEELAVVRRIDIVGASSLEGLQACTGLVEITIDQCQVDDLDFLVHAPHVETLVVTRCPLRDVTGVHHATGLRSLSLRFVLVNDTRPIFDHPRLERLVIEGAPIEGPRREDLAQLATGTGGRRAVRVDVGSLMHAGISDELVKCTGSYVVELVAEGPTVAVTFGASSRHTLEVDQLRFLDLAREPGATTDEVVRRAVETGIARESSWTPRIAPLLESGTSEEARRWIGQQPVLARITTAVFLDLFPDQVFYRYPAGHPQFDQVAQWLPDGWAGQLRILAGVGPVAPTEVRFLGFPECSESWVTPEDWFSWLPPPRPDRLLVEPSGVTFVPIAYTTDARFALAVSRQVADPAAVYVVRLGEDEPGELLADSVLGAFASIHELLQHIQAFRPYGQEPILAKPLRSP